MYKMVSSDTRNSKYLEFQHLLFVSRLWKLLIGYLKTMILPYAVKFTYFPWMLF